MSRETLALTMAIAIAWRHAEFKNYSWSEGEAFYRWRGDKTSLGHELPWWQLLESLVAGDERKEVLVTPTGGTNDKLESLLQDSLLLFPKNNLKKNVNHYRIAIMEAGDRQAPADKPKL